MTSSVVEEDAVVNRVVRRPRDNMGAIVMLLTADCCASC